MLKTIYFTLLSAVAVLCFGMLPTLAFAGTVGDPYTGTPIQVSGTPGAVTVWEAENYDKGPEGVAFHNPNPGACEAGKCSCLQVYRFLELPICGVSPRFVTYTDNGLWATYTFDIAAVGNYAVELLVAIGDAACCGAASYHLRIDGQRYPATGSYALGPTATADWNVFEWRGKSELIPLVPGTHRMLIAVDQHWFNWDSVRMTFAGAIEWGWQWGPTWKAYQ